MAFLPIIQSRSDETNHAQVRCYFAHPEAYAPRNCQALLTRAMVQRLNWHKGDRILVQLGEGKDMGSIALTRVAKGGRMLTQIPRSRMFVVHFTLPKMVGDMTYQQYATMMREGGTNYVHEIQDDATVIVSVNLPAIAEPQLKIVK